MAAFFLLLLLPLLLGVIISVYVLLARVSCHYAARWTTTIKTWAWASLGLTFVVQALLLPVIPFTIYMLADGPDAALAWLRRLDHEWIGWIINHVVIALVTWGGMLVRIGRGKLGAAPDLEARGD